MPHVFAQELLTASGSMPCDEKSVPPEWQDAMMLRFWVGFKKNCKNAAEAFGKMLVWRKDNKIDDIRDKILAGLTPEQFPRSGSFIESSCSRAKSLCIFIPSALPPSR